MGNNLQNFEGSQLNLQNTSQIFTILKFLKIIIKTMEFTLCTSKRSLIQTHSKKICNNINLF